MGGGIGHQCADFKAALFPFRAVLILQDLPHATTNGLQAGGVEREECGT